MSRPRDYLRANPAGFCDSRGVVTNKVDRAGLRQAVEMLHASTPRTPCRFGNLRHSRFGNLRYGRARPKKQP